MKYNKKIIIHTFFLILENKKYFRRNFLGLLAYSIVSQHVTLVFMENHIFFWFLLFIKCVIVLRSEYDIN